MTTGNRDKAKQRTFATGKAQIIDSTCGDSMCEDKDSYRVEVRCINCGWKGQMRVTVGHEPNTGRSIGAECLRCEVRDLTQGDFVIREVAS